MFTTTSVLNMLGYSTYCGNMQELRVDANGYPHGHVASENEAGYGGADPASAVLFSTRPSLSFLTIRLEQWTSDTPCQFA